MLTKVVTILSSISFLAMDLPVISGVNPLISIRRIELQDDMTHYTAFGTEDYKAFASDQAYVILVVETSNEGRFILKSSYWIGRKTPLEIAKSAASYTMQMHFGYDSKVDILREMEGKETNAFKAIFDPEDLTIGSSSSAAYSSLMVDENKTRMVLIGYPEFDSVKEVAFSPEHAQRLNTCFVAFNSRIIFLQCEKSVPDEEVKMRTAVYLTKILSKKMGSQVKIVTNLRGQGDAKFSDEFGRVVDAVQKFKASAGNTEVNIASDHDDDAYLNFRLLQCYQLDNHENAPAVAELKSPNITNIFSFESQCAYVFDSCLDDIGILVWLGAKANINIRKECAKNAESGNLGGRCSPTRPITFISEENVRLPGGRKRLQIYFSDFVQLMDQLHLSWTDVLKNEAASSTEITPLLES